MFIKFALTTNNRTIDLPNEISDIGIKYIRLVSMSYKTGANTSSNLKLFINGFNDKYDIDSNEKYFAFMQLTGYANTFHQYNIPVENKNDFSQNGVNRRMNQFQVRCIIDDAENFIDGSRPVVIELEII